MLVSGAGFREERATKKKENERESKHVRPTKTKFKEKKRKREKEEEENLGGNFDFAHLDGIDERQFSEYLLLTHLLQEASDDLKHTVPVHKRCEKQLKKKKKKLMMSFGSLTKMQIDHLQVLSLC